MSSEPRVFDLIIIGGGPTGLFGAFYAGMRQLSTKIIDGLPELGGQLTALYPEKYIYDMPGFPWVLAKDLVAAQVEQGLQYGAEVVLGRKVVGLHRDDDGVWTLLDQAGQEHRCRTVLITAGAGSFDPKRIPLTGGQAWEGRGIHYFVRRLESFRGKRVLVVGGGDSAVDWALALEDVAEAVTLIHRRDRFRAHEESVEKLRASGVEIALFWEISEIRGEDHLTGVQLTNNQTGAQRDLEVSDVILALGFSADIGPIKGWGLETQGSTICVNTRMETNFPGIYAAGDVVTYDGKLKLIATGVAEAAIAVNHAKTYVDPASRAFPGHSSEQTSK